MTSAEIEQLSTEIQLVAPAFTRLRSHLGSVIVGQKDMLDGLLVALLADGHVLLEGLPGLAKTTAVSTLADGFAASFQRIQFTPDLLPADVVGTLVYEPAEKNFTVRKGPVFAHLVLADEINRAPAKVQSALLEAMQERQVTIGTETHPLPKPFLVMATQNPIEQEGTYPLPEAQTDRFLLKILLEPPSIEEEREILDRSMGAGPSPSGDPVGRAMLQPEEVLAARAVTRRIYCDPRLRDYAVTIVQATRNPSQFGLAMDALIEVGASPRATLGLVAAAQAMAFLEGRGYCVPQDFKSVAPAILRHRIRPSFEAEAEGLDVEAILERLLGHLPVP
ncbi:MAG: ATPase [Phycisphaerae bacterium]|nr:ATPase [Phycisphaerae bacterium]